jgi:hypothetical protein
MKTPCLNKVRATLAELDAVINRIIDNREYNFAFETEHLELGREKNEAIIERALGNYPMPPWIGNAVASLIWMDIENKPYCTPNIRRWGTQHVLLALARIENAHARMRQCLESSRSQIPI